VRYVTGFYFEDLARLIREHAAPSTFIHFHKTRHGPVDVVSILDYSYPHRIDRLETGHSEFDWYISSFVCNATADWVPRVDDTGVWEEQRTNADGTFKPAGWTKRPKVGFTSLLPELLKEGCIVPSNVLDYLLSTDTRRMCTNGNRLHYRRFD